MSSTAMTGLKTQERAGAPTVRQLLASSALDVAQAAFMASWIKISEALESDESPHAQSIREMAHAIERNLRSIASYMRFGRLK